MRKIVVWLIVCMLAICPASMAAESWYAQEGQRLAERICELASDEAYVQMFTTDADVCGIVADFARSDFSKAIGARMLSLPDEEAMKTLLELMSALSGGEIPELSDAAQREMLKMAPGMLVTMVNQRQNMTWLAASTVLRTSETYVMPESFHPCVLLMNYPGEYSVAVVFSQTGEETVTAEATVVNAEFSDAISGELPLITRIAFEMIFKRVEVQ